MPRRCQLDTCKSGKQLTGKQRFCSLECTKADDREQARAKRKAELDQLKKLLHKYGSRCPCPNCDGSCKRKRGRPSKPPKAVASE